MKLQEVKLTNFRQHRQTAIAFGSGLLALMGHNGAGKSTVIEAISFALYGSKALRGKLDDVRTRNVSKDEPTSVELIFEHDGKTFRLLRNLHDAELFVGGEGTPLVSGTRDVSSKIAQTLGLEFDEFTAAFLTQQKGLEFLSAQKGATEREKFIVRMLGYDRLEKVQILLREDKRDLKQEILGRESGLGNEDALNKEIEVHGAALTEQERALADSDQALKRSEDALNLVKSDYETLEGKRQGYEQAKRSLNALEVRFEERSSAVNKLDAKRREILETNPKLRDQQASGVNIETLRAREETLSEQLKVEMAVLKDADSKWARQKANAEAQIRQLQLGVDGLKAEVKLHLSLKERSACPTCGQEIGEGAKQVTESMQLKLSEIERALTEAQELYLTLAKEPESIILCRVRIHQLEDQQRLARLELKEFLDSSASINELGTLTKTLEHSRAELIELEKQLRSERSRLSATDFDPDLYLALKGKYDAAHGFVNLARLQRVKLQGQVDSIKALLERARMALLELKGRKAELGKSKQRLVELEEQDEVLTHFRKYLNNAIRPRLSELASEFLNDLSDGRFTTVEVNPDFSASIVDERGARGVISGGEEDLLALCMRLALSQMLLERSGQSLSMLMLDEVFGSLDYSRRVNVLTLLEKLSERFEQIIVITHFDDLKDAVQQAIFVEYDESSGHSSVAELESEDNAEDNKSVVNF